MCKDILTVITGSHLHGLTGPDSDVDYRGVFINDVRDIVNPFEKPVDKRFIEGKGKDDTASELRKFIREVVEGNPNSIEVLFSNLVVGEATTDLGTYMRDNRDKFIGTAAVFNAFKNYAGNQLNKMSLFEPDERTPKFAVAYIRSLLNGVELIRDGVITNPVPATFTLEDGQVIEARRILSSIKFTPFQKFDLVREEAMRMFALLQVELATVFYKNKPKPVDTEWLLAFCREAYGV